MWFPYPDGPILTASGLSRRLKKSEKAGLRHRETPMITDNSFVFIGVYRCLSAFIGGQA
jgi:hypothetical protein